MARYDYRCSQCGLVSEQAEPGLLVYIHHTVDGELIEDDLESLSKSENSEVCHGKFKRVYSFGGAILKGPGFYRTDN